MKIKMLVSMASTDWACAPGDECDFPAAEAKRIIAAGFAEAIKAPAKKKAPKREWKAKKETATIPNNIETSVSE